MSSIRKRLMARIEFNASRTHLDRWAAEAGRLGREPSFTVLDAGAGSARYRKHFAAVSYETADFLAFNDSYGYAQPTYQCDLMNIPVDDGRFDLVFCTQVLEHVPDPLGVLREFRRVVKSTGQVWISTPLFYAEHGEPYDFYRYTQFGLRHLAETAGFTVARLDRLEGYYATLSYQLLTAARELPAVWLPVRFLFLLLGAALSRLDVVAPRRDIGICKNYRCVLLPTSGPARAHPR